MPNLLLIQSDEFGNMRNWRTKEKENEINFILAEESVWWKLSEGIVTIKAVPTTFAITFKTDIRV